MIAFIFGHFKINVKPEIVLGEGDEVLGHLIERGVFHPANHSWICK